MLAHRREKHPPQIGAVEIASAFNGINATTMTQRVGDRPVGQVLSPWAVLREAHEPVRTQARRPSRQPCVRKFPNRTGDRLQTVPNAAPHASYQRQVVRRDQLTLAFGVPVAELAARRESGRRLRLASHDLACGLDQFCRDRCQRAAFAIVRCVELVLALLLIGSDDEGTVASAKAVLDKEPGVESYLDCVF